MSSIKQKKMMKSIHVLFTLFILFANSLMCMEEKTALRKCSTKRVRFIEEATFITETDQFNKKVNDNYQKTFELQQPHKHRIHQDALISCCANFLVAGACSCALSCLYFLAQPATVEHVHKYINETAS